GKFEGLSTWYYNNGKLHEKGYRHLDADTGRWEDYDTTGVLIGAVEHNQNEKPVYYNGRGAEISADEYKKIFLPDQAR
ncbi:MAG: hypothetical protein ABUL46_03045, partial [Chitinophaga rupis]